MGRILALDIGTVRIGVAVSDPMGFFAQGLAVLAAEGDWMGELEKLISEYGVDRILVGMPTRTDGKSGPEAEAMRAHVAALASRFPQVELIVWDERFTTTIAQAAMIEANVSRRDRKKKIDQVAATILLQSYLDNKGASLP